MTSAGQLRTMQRLHFARGSVLPQFEVGAGTQVFGVSSNVGAQYVPGAQDIGQRSGFVHSCVSFLQ
jgi:hypothetical protein